MATKFTIRFPWSPDLNGETHIYALDANGRRQEAEQHFAKMLTGITGIKHTFKNSGDFQGMSCFVYESGLDNRGDVNVFATFTDE